MKLYAEYIKLSDFNIFCSKKKFLILDKKAGAFMIRKSRKLFRNLFLLMITLLVFFSGCTKNETPLIIYCGSGIKEPVQEIITAFEKKYNIDCKIIDSGSYNLQAVIQETKKGDLFFHPTLFSEPNLTDIEQNILQIGTNKLVMIIPKNNPKNIQSFKDLTKKNIRIAVGDPQKTNSGKIFEKIIIKSKIRDKINKNIFFKTHKGSEMMNLLIANETDVVIILKSILHSTKYQDYKTIDFPPDLDSSFKIYLSELSISKNKKNRRLFSDFVRSNGEPVLQKWGLK